MILGALVDLGVDPEHLKRRLKDLPIGSFDLTAKPVKRQGIMGTRVTVRVQEEPHTHRHLHHIIEMVEAAGLPHRAAERARGAYRRLATAEARVHGSTPDKIHFHEVGAKDAVLDVAAVMTALELLGIESFSAAPVVTGFGTVECAHGIMPVPAPATAELLRGIPCRSGAIESELATPTGVAILAELLGIGENTARPLPTDPERLVRRFGYGAGSKTFERTANYLRLELCERPPDGAGLPLQRCPLLALECEIDDMTPEVAGYLMERLFEDGALDVQFSPVQMKKNRPGLRVRVLAEPAAEAPLAEIIFRETSTFGLRRQQLERWCLTRRTQSVETPLGNVPVKIGFWEERPLKAAPEFEACRRLAQISGQPLKNIYTMVRRAIADQIPELA